MSENKANYNTALKVDDKVPCFTSIHLVKLRTCARVKMLTVAENLNDYFSKPVACSPL